MDNEHIEYLYHYTSIEPLALILKNKTFRFNSLNNMDDLQEQQTADIKNIGQFFYISSWTDDDSESIPMWNMYASSKNGVRIRLGKKPFKIYNNSSEEISKALNMPVANETGAQLFESIIPISEMITKGFYTVQATNDQFLFKVEYTDDTDKLYPHILEENGDRFSLLVGKIGKYKNTHWKFQNEWRYILNILPLDIKQLPTNLSNEFQIFVNKMRLGCATQPFAYYDMKLSNQAFEDMEITLCPQISEGNRIIVNNLVQAFNPAATIKDSCLSGLL